MTNINFKLIPFYIDTPVNFNNSTITNWQEVLHEAYHIAPALKEAKMPELLAFDSVEILMGAYPNVLREKWQRFAEVLDSSNSNDK
jgi:hypothetical protein